jgi:hypothetical protein
VEPELHVLDRHDHTGVDDLEYDVDHGGSVAELESELDLHDDVGHSGLG